MDRTFQMYQPMFVAGKIKLKRYKTLWCAFFETPCSTLRFPTWSSSMSNDPLPQVEKSNNPADHIFLYFNLIGRINNVSWDIIHYVQSLGFLASQMYLVTRFLASQIYLVTRFLISRIYLVTRVLASQIYLVTRFLT